MRRLHFPVFADARGRLIPVEHLNPHLPFVPVRTFVISDVPAGRARAGHTLRCDEVLIAVRGSLVVRVRTARAARNSRLRRPGEALYLRKGTWISLRNFSADAVLLVLASEPYRKRK
jgi:UDP-2-acetamido-3-amino-2,3-dideoxy-glucuronate N-acetyltransferase